LTRRPDLPWTTKLVACAWAIAALVAIAGLMEGKAWSRALEGLRLVTFVPVVWLLAVGTRFALPVMAAAAALAFAQALLFLRMPAPTRP
jgi:hypothetical protein